MDQDGYPDDGLPVHETLGPTIVQLLVILLMLAVWATLGAMWWSRSQPGGSEGMKRICSQSNLAPEQREACDAFK